MSGHGTPPRVSALEELDRNPSGYLYAVRDAAGKAADELTAAFVAARGEEKLIRSRLERAIAEAEKVAAELSHLAQRMETAAELVAASDLEPNASAVVPGEAGLVRAAETPPLTLEQLHALPPGSWVRTASGEQWFRRVRYWSRRGPIQSKTPSDVLYANAAPLHLLEKEETDA